MSITVEASGTAALIVSDPATTLATINTNKILLLTLDLNAAAAADVFVVEVRTKARNTGALVNFITWTFSGVQAQPINVSVPVGSAYSADFKIQQIAGANRSVPWRIDSIGAVSILAEGTQTSVLTTEHTLATISSSKNVSLVADLTNMIAGDTVELRIKQRVLAAGATREEVLATYVGVQNIPMVQSIPISSPFECIVTLKQTAGVVHAYDWRLDSF